MERPAPILWFSRFYLSGLVLRTAGTLVDWPHANAGLLQIWLMVALLLWFGVVHRGSNVARWIVLISYVPWLLWAGLSLVQMPYPPLTVVLYVASLVFFSAATVQLVAESTTGWFAAKPAPNPGA